MKVTLEYGAETCDAELPDDTLVVRPNITYEEPKATDPVAATERALSDPLGSEPIRNLVRRGSHVAIAFPDRVKGGTHALSHTARRSASGPRRTHTCGSV